MTQLWVPPSTSTSEYELVVGAVAKATLTVMIVGPRPEDSPPGSPNEMAHMTACLADGGQLDFLGMTVAGSKRHSLYVGEFSIPEAPGALTVSLERFGAEVFTGVATPLPAASMGASSPEVEPRD